MSAPGPVSTAGEAEGRAEPRRGGAVRAGERDTQTMHSVMRTQGARGAKQYAEAE